jgi:hypothetical protein
MILDETTDAFWVLYLINVFQPIDTAELDARSRRLIEAAGRKIAADFNISHALAALVRAHMAVLGSDGHYAVTVLGLRKLSQFNLGLSRDKNRMFVLKDRFKNKR